MVNIIMWLYLITFGQHGYGKVITVNKNGNDSLSCCAYGDCVCSSLSKALSYTENNTVINITSHDISLATSVSIGLGNLTNITITGNYGATVMCNNTGTVFCDMCSNVSIESITWDQCGNISHPTSPGISFNAASNISISHCIFQHFKVCTAVNITDAAGAINVVNSTFRFNVISNASLCHESYYSGLLVVSSRSIVLRILDSLFFRNGNYSTYYWNSGAFVYRGYYSQSYLELFVYNTGFVSNGFKAMVIDDNFMVSDIAVDTVNVSNNVQGVYVSAGFNSSLNIFSSHFAENNSTALLLFLPDSILDLHNTTFQNNYGWNVLYIYVYRYSIYSTIKMSHCKFTHNSFVPYARVVYISVDSETTVSILQCIFNNNVGRVLYIFADSDSTVNISQCTFNDNVGYRYGGIMYVTMRSDISNMCSVFVSSSIFTNNKNGSALMVAKCFLRFISSITLFQNNSAENGGALYIEQGSQITVDNESTVQFINNTASLRGGAIYIDFSDCYGHGIVFNNLTKNNSIYFIDNSAKLSGDSMYFNIPDSCEVGRDCAINDSAAYIPFNISYTSYSIESPIVTSPYGIKLCSNLSTCEVNGEQSDNEDNNCVIPEKKMLGQSIHFNITLYDYFNAAAEAVTFQVKCINCGPKLKLFRNRILVHSEITGEVKILAVNSTKDLENDTNVTIEISSLLSPEYRQLTATLSLTLSSCYNGFTFSNRLQQCECYTKDDYIQCQGDSASIKLGNWFGIFSGKRTLSKCHHEYCNFFIDSRDETGNGFYNLPAEIDDQCNLHRTGVACGQCSEGYTLAYNSPDCISVDKCSPGMIVLVVVLTVLYWIGLIAFLFGTTYYFKTKQISLGYLYGITYFYSIVDIILVTKLHITDAVFYIVVSLSSFAKLDPQFLGRLCFIKDLDAIDQQFIHYCHVMFALVTSIGIVVTAKCNKRAFVFVKNHLAPVSCLLLLFSYTSLTSTSLLILNAVSYDNHDGLYTYLSPHLKYFSDLHAVYASLALLCGLFVTIGFPFLLIVEPFIVKVFDGHLNKHAPRKAVLQIEKFMKKKFFVRIKLLLDKLQECYKDQHRWFAAYYLICRLVIMLITYYANDDYNNMIYYLQTACVVIAMTHIWIQPYKDDVINVMDAVILLITLFIVNLSTSTFRFSTSITCGIAISLIFAPLLLLFCVGAKKLSVRKFMSTNQNDNYEFELIPFPRDNDALVDKYCELQESLLILESDMSSKTTIKRSSKTTMKRSSKTTMKRSSKTTMKS